MGKQGSKRRDATKNQANDEAAGTKPAGVLDTLLNSALRSAVKIGDTLNAIEKAAGLSISLGVSREMFVESIGQAAGMLYDAAAERRKRAAADPAPPPPADEPG